MAADGDMHELDKGGEREASTVTVQPVSQPLPASIEEMDQLIDSEVKSFVESSKGLDPLVEEQVSLDGSATKRGETLLTGWMFRLHQSPKHLQISGGFFS